MNWHLQSIKELVCAGGVRTLSDSSPYVLGRLRPCRFGKLIPEVSSAHMVSISSLYAELLRFWNGPVLQDSTCTRPGAPEHSRPIIKFHHLLVLEAGIILGRRGQVGTGHTGTESINVLVVKFRQILVFVSNYFPAPTKRKAN